MPDTDNPINLIPGRGQALGRAADAILRWLGAGRVTLRIADPSTGDTSSQLGIEPPTSEDIIISPVAVRAQDPAKNGDGHWEVMFSAKALRAAAEPYGVTDLTNWLLTSQGVCWRGKLLSIKSVIVQSFADGECFYLAIATE